MATGFTRLTPESIQTSDGINLLNNMLESLYDLMPGDTDTVRIYKGYGTPESVITAGVGSLYLRLDGGVTTTLYVKTSGTGATGWTAK